MVLSLRKIHPDVPDDAVVLEHWNDPNYDFDQQPSSPMAFELDAKHTRHSFTRTSTSDFDTESRASTGVQYSDAKLLLLEEDSPYAEVRAAVPNIDEPSMPCNTFRVWIIGLIFSICIPGTNQLLSLRYPNVLLTSLFAQLVALPMGKFMEHVLPTTRFTTLGYTWCLNPGPFNVKEHTVLTVIAKTVEQGAYATDLLLSQELFYGQKYGFGYDIMIVWSSQIMGYSFGSFIRPILVWPASMIWPGALVNSALFTTLHKSYRVRETNHMSREKFLLIAMICSFVWYWLPGFLWTGLSMFNWVCWIAPASITVNALFGTATGLGMGVLTFDWAMISFIGSPLVTPWWAQLNVLASFVFFQWIIMPIIYFTNTWNSSYLPISTSTTFDNTGAPYNISLVVTNGVFDETKYRNYSPVFLSAVFVMAYCLDLAGYTAVLVHTSLWYGRDIMRQLRQSLEDQTDVHARLMRAYKEVPHWWYGVVFIVSFILGVVTIEKYHTDLPIWAYCLCILLGATFIIPFGIILAYTNSPLGLNTLSEILAGLLVPNRPIAVMIFKTYSTIIADQGTRFAASSKLGYYMKVAPRVMFVAQVVATTISCFVCVGVQRWALDHIPGICHRGQANGFICPSSNTFAQASIIFGGIGPNRFFGMHGSYPVVRWFLLIGAISPIPFYFLAKKYPRRIFRYINMPVFWFGTSAQPSATGINYSSWGLTGFIFQFYMRRYRFMWWMRYNYILSIALDFGVAVSSLLIFFTVVYPNGGVTVSWWGNNVYQNTADWMGLPLKTVAPGEIFGPKVWS